MTQETETRQRLRLVFSKNKAVKYIGHLDLALAWERALRRANVPIAYSQGFNPRPKMQFASSLPLGTMGTAEILDLILNEPVPLENFVERMNETLPIGIRLHKVMEVPFTGPTLQNLLREADYRVLVETELSEAVLAQRIAALLAEESYLITRRRKKRQEKLNIRPLIEELTLLEKQGEDALFHMRLSAGQHGNLRPEHVLKALDLTDNWAEIERTRLYFLDDAEQLTL